jgi:chromosome segregation ATPase
MSNGVKESFGKEVAKSSRVVQSVRDEMQRERVGAKTAFEELSSDVNSKLEQHVNESKSMTADLATKMMQDREEIDEQLTMVNNEVKVVKGDLVGITKEWKGEHEKDRSLYKQNFEQINSEISNLRNKLSEYPTAMCCINTSRPAEQSHKPGTSCKKELGAVRTRHGCV